MMIAVKEQSMIEVYSNDAGEIAIKSQPDHMDEPQHIYFWPEHAEAIIAAIKAEQKNIENREPIQAELPV